MTQEAFNRINEKLTTSGEVEGSLRPTIEHQLIAKALNSMFVQAQQAGHAPHQIGMIRISNMRRGHGSPHYVASAEVRTRIMGHAKAEDMEAA